MTNKILILVAILILTGCSAQKWCWNKFPPEIKIDTVIHTETTYKDTTIFVHLPGDTLISEVPVYIIDTIEGEPIVITYEEAIAETGYAEARAWIQNSMLQLELIQKDSLIEVTLDSVIAIKDHYVELYTTEIHKSPPQKRCPVKSIILYLLIGFFAGAILVFIIKLKK